MADTLRANARVWFKNQGLWTAATTVGSDAINATFKSDDGETFTIPVAQIDANSVTLMHQSSIDGTPDMATLGDLHEGAILQNIRLRFKNSEIYTYIGSILAAVNPYKSISDLYKPSKLSEYKQKAIGELPPHIYAIANEAYYAMWKGDKDQVVLISGESGAGKTESTKYILRFLSNLSNQSMSENVDNKASKRKSFEDQIQNSSPIMEAFGNGKTVYNNNSSRFGKFVRVSFNSGGVIEGGKIIDYLLEKNRVVRQNKNERNFHIFYNFMLGNPEPVRLKLTGRPQDYYYLNQSGVVKIDGMDDLADWKLILEAFGTMGFSPENQSDIFSILASILHLGNIKFITAGGAQVEKEAVVGIVAGLLGCDASSLSEALTTQKRVLRGEVISTPNDVTQAADTRDSLAMSLYGRMFKWIIQRINSSLKGSESFHAVGVLDIFGFENFEVNSFEQFNINYANEKLQQYFNRHIFSLEQLEYNREGISWDEIDWVDNAECLDLIERKLGILSLVDEEARFPKGTDDTLLQKLHAAQTTNSAFYIKPKVANSKFGIKHYAGEVMYESVGFLDKNRDTFREELLDVLQASQNDFIYDLFEHDSKADSSSTTARKKPTVSNQFKESLASLMQTLSIGSPFFVRCLKPNMEKVKDVFNTQTILNQLRYSGMMETVRIRRAGFPVRREFADFLFRYRVFQTGLVKPGTAAPPAAELCKKIMAKFEPVAKNWQIGKSKVFMREKLEVLLETKRYTDLKKQVQKIQAVILGNMLRKRYLAIRKLLIKIQAWYKRAYHRALFLKKKKAATKIKAYWKMYKAVQLLKKLREARRIELERLAAEERRKEAERKAELARLEKLAREAAAADAAARERAEKELAAAKARQEAEKKVRDAAEAQKKAAEEKAMRETMARAAHLEQEHKVKEEQQRKEQEEKDRIAAELSKIKELEKQAALAAKEEAAVLAREAKQDQLSQAKELLEEKMEADREEFSGFGGEVGKEDFGEFGFGEGGSESREGYLGMFRGVMKNLKKRWCVLHDDTFMWFRGKQDFIKAGWLTKMGGGSSTLGRKNWKRRWMTVKKGMLQYLPSEEEDAELLGEIDIRNCEKIMLGDEEDIGIKKENSFAIVTPKRTYFMYGDSPDEAIAWVELLNRVKSATDEELDTMMASARVDPRNSQGTLSMEDIISVGPMKQDQVDGHPIFIVETSEQLYKFVASDLEDLTEWIRLLTPKKSGAAEAGTDLSVQDTERGWMSKESGKNQIRRRRWFVLRGDVITYYKNPTDDFSVGSIPLNSLCSVIPPDEDASRRSNDWTFTIHARRKSFQLTCKRQEDCTRWLNAIQDVIDNSPVMITPTEKLIDDLKMCTQEDVDAMYAAHKILLCSSEPLRTSLLPLQYGTTSNDSGREYGTLLEEALKFSVSLQPVLGGGKAVESGPNGRYGAPNDECTLIKNILQVCFDLPKLRNEVYAQAIKLTTASIQPGSPLNMCHWHFLGGLCCSFLPARKFLRFLRFHLKRTIELAYSVGPDVVNAANFCLEALKKTKSRDFPPSTEEIKGIIAGTGLVAKIHCINGQNLSLPISSSTTCGEVIAVVKEQLNLTKSRNGFGLFETCGVVDKFLEEKYVISDILSKWEKYVDHGIGGGQWELVFKLFSFYDPTAANLSQTEQEFLFEQANDSVVQKRYPADDDMLIQLAALRYQYLVGPWDEGDYVSDLVKVHPLQQAQLLAEPSSSGSGIAGTLKKAGTLFKGTLKGLGASTLRRLKGETGIDEQRAKDLEKAKGKILTAWKSLKKLDKDSSRVKYMQIVQSWDGYGANLFEVEQTSNKAWPKELWLAISLNGVGIFPRGERKRIAFYKYETVLSFGAPVANKYKIMVDNVGSMLFDTNMVLEIAKLMKEYIKEIVTRRR